MTDPAARAPSSDEAREVHPLIVRVTHWINAFAVIVMILSGWRIYNAAPIYNFEFAAGFTLGGWLAGALAWHFAAMWLLAANGLVYLVYGFVSGHFLRTFLPVSFRGAMSDLRELPRIFRNHSAGRYNSAQRLVYFGAFLGLVVVVLSGLAIWKPVQFQELTGLMGGYDGARRVHFFAMAAIVAFLAVHVSLALTVQGVLTPMVTGRPERRR